MLCGRRSWLVFPLLTCVQYGGAQDVPAGGSQTSEGETTAAALDEGVTTTSSLGKDSDALALRSAVAASVPANSTSTSNPSLNGQDAANDGSFISGGPNSTIADDGDDSDDAGSLEEPVQSAGSSDMSYYGEGGDDDNVTHLVHRRRSTIVPGTASSDIVFMHLGGTSFITPVQWVGQYRTLDAGKCRTTERHEPVNSLTKQVAESQCVANCDQSTACYGYSWEGSADSVVGDCIVYTESDLRGGGPLWGKASCIVKIFLPVKKDVTPASRYVSLGAGRCLRSSGMDYPHSVEMKATSSDDCEAACNDKETCFAYTFEPTTRQCYLWEEAELRADGKGLTGKEATGFCKIKVFRVTEGDQTPFQPANMAPAIGPGEEISYDVVQMPLGRTTSSTATVWSGSYDTLGPKGRCVNLEGMDPVQRYVNNVLEEQCRGYCDHSPACYGFSWASDRSCLMWMESDLVGGGRKSGDESCIVKRIAILTAPVASDGTFSQIGRGRCVTTFGTNPQTQSVGQVGNGRCARHCEGNPACYGYSWTADFDGKSRKAKCLIFTESGLRSGQDNWGDFSCNLKNYGLMDGENVHRPTRRPFRPWTSSTTTTSTTTTEEGAFDLIGAVLPSYMWGGTGDAGCSTELPNTDFPGMDNEESHNAWPSGRQPENGDCWPKSDNGNFDSCYYKRILRDTDVRNWPGKCLGLHEKLVEYGMSCMDDCYQDPLCAVWQEHPNGKCYQGVGEDCYNKRGSLGFVPKGAQRVQHGEIRVLLDLYGIEVNGLKRFFDQNYFNDREEGIAHCKELCYSNIRCQYWTFGDDGCRAEEPPENKAPYPLTTSGISRTSGYAKSVVAGQYIQHVCPQKDGDIQGEDRTGFLEDNWPYWPHNWPWVKWRIWPWNWGWRIWAWEWWHWCIIGVFICICGCCVMGACMLCGAATICAPCVCCLQAIGCGCCVACCTSLLGGTNEKRAVKTKRSAKTDPSDDEGYHKVSQTEHGHHHHHHHHHVRHHHARGHPRDDPYREAHSQGRQEIEGLMDSYPDQKRMEPPMPPPPPMRSTDPRDLPLNDLQPAELGVLVHPPEPVMGGGPSSLYAEGGFRGGGGVVQEIHVEAPPRVISQQVQPLRAPSMVVREAAPPIVHRGVIAPAAYSHGGGSSLPGPSFNSAAPTDSEWF